MWAFAGKAVVQRLPANNFLIKKINCSYSIFKLFNVEMWKDINDIHDQITGPWTGTWGL